MRDALRHLQVALYAIDVHLDLDERTITMPAGMVLCACALVLAMDPSAALVVALTVVAMAAMDRIQE